MKFYLHKQNYLNKCSKSAFVHLLVAFTLVNVSYAAPGSAGDIATVKSTLLTARENVTGTVRDDQGEPLPGVTVKIKGTNTATVTDVNGVYRINLPTGDETLVLSFIGFETKEIAVAGRTSLDVTLIESSSRLDEVVVTGYGSKKRSEIVGSVATVTGEELQDIPAPNIAAALRNRVAGVSVDQTSGKPGTGIRLNIRNSSTAGFAGGTDEPLYIIDGITMPNSEAFNNLDASMIENITILKDASAAIYGAAGAKGAVLVTTKRGKAGKPSITYNGYVGVSDAAKDPEMLSAYQHALMLNEGNIFGNRSASTFFSTADLEYLRNLKTNSWYDELWQASTTQRHNLSVSGGSEKLTFFVGGSFQNENGNYAGLKQDKYTLRSGVTASILPGLKADIAFNIDHRIRNANNDLGSENDADFFRSIVTTPHWVPMVVDGKPVDFGTNPYGILNSGYYDNRNNQGYRVNASLTYQPEFLKGLTAKFQISQGGTSGKDLRYRAPYSEYSLVAAGNNGYLYENTILEEKPVTSTTNSELVNTATKYNGYQGFFTLQYGRTIANHTFDLTVGGEQTVSDNESIRNTWRNQLVPQVDEPWGFDPNQVSVPTVGIFESTKRSFFGRFSYDFNKKYLIEAVTRLDASSNFASGNRWGVSPSVGLGWIVSKEPFFRDNVPFVNFLKLKVNYGLTGDDRVEQRLWQERYAVSLNDGYIFGNNNGIGINPKDLPNPNITWEKKQTFNAGLEASLFNNKFDFGVEVFRNRVYDGFDGGLNNIYPMYAGFASAVVNNREVYNWGSEFTLGYRAKLGREVNFSTNVNFSFGNSVVTREIYNPNVLWLRTPEDDEWVLVGTDPRKYNSGNMGLISKGILRTQADVDALLAATPNYTFDGQIPEVGWLHYEDVNQDGMITEADMVPLYDNPTPFLSSGISFNLGYKDFSLSTNLLARFGGKVFYDSRARTRPTQAINVASFWEDRWTPQNPMSGMMPRFDDPSIGVNSDYWAVDGTMIRINNMTLSYKLPESLAKRVGLGSARILATGSNLWTLVNPLKYKDPYTSSAYDYPTIRTISLGLSVNL